MRRVGAGGFLVGGAVAMIVSFSAHARPPARRGPPTPPPLPPPAVELLPRFVELSHVDVLASAEAALVTLDLAIQRAGWDGASFDFFVAYGAPGLPAAFEARALVSPDDGVMPLQTTAGEALPTSHAYEAPSHAGFSVGPRQGAGQVVHVDAATLGRVLSPAPTARAFLRLRAVHRFVGATRFVPGVLVRLDTPRLGVLPLGAVTVRAEGEQALGAAATTSAKLCRVDGTTIPLRIAQGASDVGLAPLLTKRSAGEDLCVDLR